MTWPWRLVRWAAPYPVSECAERLTAAAGTTTLPGHAARFRVKVTLTGLSFLLVVTESSRVPRGKASLRGMLVRHGEGTFIFGRFNPDPFVVGAAVVAVWLLALASVAVLTVSSAGLEHLAAYWFGTRGGLLPLTVGLVLIVAGLLRSVGWRRQCAFIRHLVSEACRAEESVGASLSARPPLG
jgi:hypothetical protein